MIWKQLLQLNQTVVQRGILINARNISITKALLKDHYEVLGVRRSATQNEIKNAYFELSKVYHPDRIAATDDNLAKFREITTAYEVLGNEQTRKLYDRGLIGEDKLGIDAQEDPNDPIIQFYRQRQQRSKVGDWKEEAELDAWTRKVSMGGSKVFHKKNELFSYGRRTEPDDLGLQAFLPLYISALIIAFAICAQLENHPIEVFLRDFF